MSNQMSSEPTDPGRAKYDAPHAQRLNDAVQASGGQCLSDGNTAYRDCLNGTGATACKTVGNTAYEGCYGPGNSATECGNGNSPD